MAKTPKLRLLKDRMRDIEEQMARLRGMLVELETQASELKIAERVLASLSIDDEEDEAPAPAPAPKTVPVGTAIENNFSQGVLVMLDNGNGHVEKQGGVRKPDGIPTMPEMIFASLQNSAALGEGLEPRQMTDYIRKKWWPDLSTNTVSPIAWRMYKRKELTKRGTRYYLAPPRQAAS